MHPLVALAVAAATLATPAAAAPALTDAHIRAFLAQQEKAWNTAALPAYFSAFEPKATFTDQYRTPAGKLVPYGTSTLAQARAQTTKFRARSKVAETHRIVRITLSPDGRSAQVLAYVTSQITTGATRRTTCAERRQELVLAGGRVRSQGVTDTFVRCGR
ncbi:hypothetical protein [Phenylobacterium sp.]|uniref:hypothetical protein n=1 Tax=Phenylobacterium sp. TaxID=1871053 RepID=UPI002F93407F